MDEVMAKNENLDENEPVAAENKETVMRLATKIIEPALQTALSEARAEGTPQEVVSALANCYVGLLVDLVGRKGASALLLNHASHVLSREEEPVTN